jgi:nucleoside-diphosphate-sugar epimerase
MKVLVIGGTRFVGYQLVWQLLFKGHHVTTLNRGTHGDPFGERIERLQADRTTPRFAEVLQGRSFDAVVDFAAFTGADVQGVLDVLGERAGHYVHISTGSVYVVLEEWPKPARESDYAGQVMPAPADERDRSAWLYGVEKRQGEDLLVRAWDRDRFPSTRIRIPVVNGEGDYSRRLEAYLWRIRDGGPILLPDGGAQPVRHVYSRSVAAALAGLVGEETTFGQAYNLAQDEIPTVAEMVEIMAEAMGAPARIVPVTQEEIDRTGLTATDLSPFSSRWNSMIDPGKAKLELRFRHVPLRDYLERCVSSFLAYPPPDPPDFYKGREREL